MNNNKIMKSYRFSPFVCSEIKKWAKKMNVKETYFVEMSILEKIAHIQEFGERATNNTNNVKTTQKGA